MYYTRILVISLLLYTNQNAFAKECTLTFGDNTTITNVEHAIWTKRNNFTKPVFKNANKEKIITLPQQQYNLGDLTKIDNITNFSIPNTDGAQYILFDCNRYNKKFYLGCICASGYKGDGLPAGPLRTNNAEIGNTFIYQKCVLDPNAPAPTPEEKSNDTTKSIFQYIPKNTPKAYPDSFDNNQNRNQSYDCTLTFGPNEILTNVAFATYNSQQKNSTYTYSTHVQEPEKNYDLTTLTKIENEDIEIGCVKDLIINCTIRPIQVKTDKCDDSSQNTPKNNSENNETQTQQEATQESSDSEGQTDSNQDASQNNSEENNTSDDNTSTQEQESTEIQAGNTDTNSVAPFDFTALDGMLNKYFDNSSVWKNDEGGFNTARLASDSIAGVILGTTGGIVTSKIIKKNQIKSGFESLKCTIGGQDVANFGDEFQVGVK